MEEVKIKVRKIYENKYFPILIFFILILTLHLFLKLTGGDDGYFSNSLNNKNIIQYTIDRYNTASSRNIIEIVLVLILKLPTSVWKTLDSLVLTLGVFSIFKLFIEGTKKEKEKIWLVCVLVLIYPFIEMSSAGWGATTLNYVWPTSLGLFSLISIKKIVKKEKINWYEYVAYLLAFIFACNHEQSCMIMSGIYIILNVYLIKKKKINKFVILESLILTAMVIYIALSQGNKIRAFDEIGNWMFEFGTFSLIDKVNLGITATMSKVICNPNLIFTITTVIMMITILKKEENVLYKIISIIPVSLIFAFGLFRQIFINIFPNIEEIYNMWTQEALLINAVNYNYIISYIPLILSLISVFCILIEILIIFKNSKEVLLPLIIMILGFGSRFAMGMSPTIFASLNRTFIFLDFAFIILSLLVWDKICDGREIKEEKRINMISIISIIAIMQYLNTFITLIDS